MAVLASFLTRIPVAPVSLAAAGAALAVSLWATLASRARLRRLVRLLEERDLAGTLRDLGGALPDLRRRLNGAETAVRQLTEYASSSVTTPGIVQFRAYDTVGPVLSFSLALLDRHGDGLVLTSLFGRSDTRVYAKRIAAGAPATDLSPEETEALRLARAGGGTIVWEGARAPGAAPRR